MEQGPVEETIVEQCARQKLPLPKKIRDAPELHLGLEFYFSAFFDLTTCRPGGMGMYPIPWKEILRYGLFFQLSFDQMEDLFFFMRRMDEAWITYFEKKQNKEKPKPKQTRTK